MQEYVSKYADQFRYDYAISREQTNAAGQKMYIQTKMAEPLASFSAQAFSHVSLCTRMLTIVFKFRIISQGGLRVVRLAAMLYVGVSFEFQGDLRCAAPRYAEELWELMQDEKTHIYMRLRLRRMQYPSCLVPGCCFLEKLLCNRESCYPARCMLSASTL